MNLSPEELQPWAALSIGNSRLHWFYYEGHRLAQAWDMPHMDLSEPNVPTTWEEWQAHSPAFASCSTSKEMLELWILSVVPAQALFWQTYPLLKVITAAHLPLKRPYPTFGLDRALAIWAAGIMYHWPVLVIDAGTALTYTGALSPADCLGGAILPGLGLQLRSLSQATPELPITALPQHLPDRWSLTTDSAIQSGILHTLISSIVDFIADWIQQYPTSQVVLTGGDAEPLYRYLVESSETKPNPHLTDRIILQPLLQGLGFLHLHQQQSNF